jgi:recombination protein RecT
MSELVKTENQAPAPTWLDLINEVGPTFNEMAKSHKAVRWAEECEFAHEIVSKNKMLCGSIVQTVQNSIKNVAAVGLTLNPAHGYAYLVPEYNKQLNGTECQLRISFKGLIKLATDSGSVKWVKAEVVHQNDVFSFNGHGNAPTHNFNPFVDRGPMVGVYCQAKTNEGDFLVDMMTIDEINKIKSAAKIQTVWEKWFEEMAKKAVIKRASKQWPKTDQFERVSTAVDILNNNEGNTDEDYTQEQYDKYHGYLEGESAIAFAAYARKLPEGAYNALYNSFEKGDKTAGKQRATKKEQEGLKLINSIVSDMQSDDEEIKEDALAGLSALEQAIVNKYVQQEAASENTG